MNLLSARPVTVLLAACLLVGNAAATRTRSFLVEGPQTLLKAKVNGVSVTDDGTVIPGPATKLVGPDAGAQVWSLLQTRDGVIYAGSGSDGTVYRLSGDRFEKAGTTFEYEVFALVEGRDGRIFASGAPNATVVEILRDGKITTLFDTPEKIIWSLLSDKEGNLFASTGDRGYVYRISPKGDGAVLYRAEESHVASLAWSKDGMLIAGTDGRGLLIEIDPHSGQGKVLYDASLPEIPKVVVGPAGEIYFAAAGDSELDGPSAMEADKKADIPEKIGGALLYVRQPNGDVRVLWNCPERMIHSLCLDARGRVLVGTGDKAALYRIAPDGAATLLWRPEEGQVLALQPDGESIVAATGNPGRLYRLEPEPGEEAWIRLEPLDAGSTARWGRAVWEALPGSGRWQLRTRSGYTEKPDSSWSDWSAPSTDPEGSPVTSPPSRYLQLEARFRGDGEGAPARLRRIWLPYSEPNLPPRVSAVRLSPDPATPPKEGQDGGSYTQDLGGGVRAEFQRSSDAAPGAGGAEPPPWVRSVRSIAWDAEDPNGDTLVFDVALRQVGEEKFRALTRDDPIPAFALDTEKLPDGIYEVQVIAKDAPSNPPGEALSVEKTGGPFRIDHRPPVFVELKARRDRPLMLVVDGSVRDEGSPLQQFEVSWDGLPWRPVGAVDGFIDSREESLHVEIPLQREGEGSWIAVRALDAAGNASIQRVWLSP